MNNWTKLNNYLIITLGLLTGLKYIIEYNDLLNDKFIPDAIRFVFVAFPAALYCGVLIVISIKKKDNTSIAFDFFCGLLQLLVIGLRGKFIPIYGTIMSVTIILIAGLLLILKIKKRIK